MANLIAKPFLKWVGGKQQLLPHLDKYFPESLNGKYIEPFVGGGAFFFHLLSNNRLPNRRYLFDINSELVNSYRVVRDNLLNLIELLSEHKGKHSKEYYYEIRELDRQNISLNDIEKAARTIYLNKTCYNGLYRVNRRGQFNTPIGKYENPTILDKQVLKAASLALQGTTIEAKDFRKVANFAEPDDFIYFDPPYNPISKTANFTSYTENNFNESDQQDIARIFRELTDRGCLCLLSNSYSELILDLYNHQRFNIEIVDAKRSINRSKVKEVIITNRANFNLRNISRI